MAVPISDLAPVSVTISGGATHVLAVLAVALPFNLAIEHQRHSGRRFASSSLHSGGGPVLTLTMPARQAVDVFGLGLTKLSDIKVYLSTYADGLRATGAAHSYLQAATGGFAVIESIQAAHRQIATATVRIIPIASSDVANPITRVDSAALPSLAAEPVLNTLGTIDIAGTVREGLQEIQIALNPLLTPVESDGRRFAREVLYQGGNPVVTGQHAGPLGLNTAAGFDGLIVTASTDVYFRENDATNRTLKTTGMRFEFGDGVLQVDDVQAQQDQAALSSFMITGRSDDDDHPLTYTASASLP